MSTNENKRLARRLFDELWNRGNLEVVDELAALASIRIDSDKVI